MLLSAIDRCKNSILRGVPGVADPLLCAVKDPVITTIFNRSLKPCDIGSCARLGETERRKFSTSSDRLDKTTLLILASSQPNRCQRKVIRHHRGCKTGTAPGDLLDYKTSIEDREPGPTQLYRNCKVNKTESVALFNYGKGKFSSFIELRCDWPDLIQRKSLRNLP